MDFISAALTFLSTRNMKEKSIQSLGSRDYRPDDDTISGSNDKLRGLNGKSMTQVLYLWFK